MAKVVSFGFIYALDFNSGLFLIFMKFSFLAKPTLMSQVPPQSAELGDHHKVKFSFDGTGPFSFKVKRNGKEISPKDTRVKLNTFDDHANLVFSGKQCYT